MHTVHQAQSESFGLAVATEMGVEDGGTLGKVQGFDGSFIPIVLSLPVPCNAKQEQGTCEWSVWLCLTVLPYLPGHLTAVFWKSCTVCTCNLCGGLDNCIPALDGTGSFGR